MTAIDVWAACAASLASGALAIRARMLRPSQSTWSAAPLPVWGGMSLLALALAMAAVSLWFGAHASAREALTYSFLAGQAVVMLWNLNRHGLARELQRQAWRDEAAAAIAASGPAATYPCDRQHG